MSTWLKEEDVDLCRAQFGSVDVNVFDIAGIGSIYMSLYEPTSYVTLFTAGRHDDAIGVDEFQGMIVKQFIFLSPCQVFITLEDATNEDEFGGKLKDYQVREIVFQQVEFQEDCLHIESFE